LQLANAFYVLGPMHFIWDESRVTRSPTANLKLSDNIKNATDYKRVMGANGQYEGMLNSTVDMFFLVLYSYLYETSDK